MVFKKLVLLLFSFYIFSATCIVSAETRIALVIGNGGYSFSPLANPPEDARIMTDALSQTGFEVIQLKNASQKKMKQAVREFSDRLKASQQTVALFYYAGHGVQFEGRNYLIPTDADIRSQQDVEFESIDAQWVLDTIKESHSGLSVIVLDACRNNPFAASTRSATRGLVRMDAPRGSILAYSTSPGKEALDGEGSNSPYSHALANAITQPGLKIEDVFKQVRRDVLASTANTQVPWESSSLTDDFYFSGSTSSSEGQQVAIRNTAKEVNKDIKNVTSSKYRSGEVFADCDQCPDMVVIPSGQSTIGSNKSEQEKGQLSVGESGEYEKPEFTVSLPSFSLAKTEITRGQFRKFIESSSYKPSAGCWLFKTILWKFDKKRNWANPGFSQDDHHPVVCVNWDDANAYAQWLADTTGKKYRLASEVEWEYAARGGKQSKYFWGESISRACEFANVYDVNGKQTIKNKWQKHSQCDDGAVYTRSVAMYKANDFGLFDMIGNVMEWVDDCWTTQHDVSNSSGDSRRDGGCAKRVQKGSHFNFSQFSLRPAARWADEPIDRSIYGGFRVMREL